MTLNKVPINMREINYDELPAKPTFQVSFDGYDFADCESVIFLSGSNEFDLANVRLEKQLAPRNDGGLVVSHNITDRNLRFNLLIKKETQLEFEQTLDAIKKAITKTEGEMIFFMAGMFRKTRASVIKFERQNQQPNELTRGEYALEFVCLDDFVSVEPVSITNNVSQNVFNYNIINQGTKETYPTLYFTLSTGSISEITITHNGFAYNIPQAMVAGDVLILYGENSDKFKEQNAYLNDTVLIETFGRYPVLKKDSNIIAFNITSPGYTATTTFIYHPSRY